MAPPGLGSVWPSLTGAVDTLAALAQEKVVVQQLLSPHARWQSGIAVGDESLGEAVQVAVGRHCQQATREGHAGRRLARVVQYAAKFK
jgi:hypothetical protein